MVPFLPITILTIEVVHRDLWHPIASCHLSFNRWHIGWPATGITGRSMRDQYLNTRWRDSYKFPLICLPLMSLFRPPEIFLSFISPPTLYGSRERHGAISRPVCGSDQSMGNHTYCLQEQWEIQQKRFTNYPSSVCFPFPPLPQISTYL